jgi:hypothetical protein
VNSLKFTLVFFLILSLDKDISAGQLSAMQKNQIQITELKGFDFVWDGGSVRFVFKTTEQSNFYLLALHRTGTLKQTNQKIFISDEENLKQKEEILPQSSQEAWLVGQLEKLAEVADVNDSVNLILLISLIKHRVTPWPKYDDWVRKPKKSAPQEAGL